MEPARYEITALHHDGSSFEVEVNSQRVELADGPAVFVFPGEMTERKGAEPTLLACEERLKSTMVSMLEGGQIIGFAWRYLYLNDTAAAQRQRDPRYFDAYERETGS